MRHTEWPDRRLLELLGIEVPIIQAPMAGAQGAALTVAVSEAGGLGSLPCAFLDVNEIRSEVSTIRASTSRPMNLNFFCHARAGSDGAEAADATWRRLLEPYFDEFGLDVDSTGPDVDRAPFDSAMCDVVEELRPEVVSFHFGLPEPTLVARVKATGATMLSSATTVAEARWLADRGCDVVIAQGVEAGGHRAMFLATGIADVATQLGTIALVPQVADAVDIPVIAAGGIADARGVAAAFALGASGVQIGTAYLFCPEANVRPLHAAALRDRAASDTALTNVFTGRPARGMITRLMREVGPLCPDAPPFPLAARALASLRSTAERDGDTSFTSLWSGQGAPLARDMPAGDLTRTLAAEALQRLH